ncbi:MAG: DUF11 domain-containing protein, partial [Pseudomonadales bacterium]|nr:DUF11 domain-containing protein [Pseudomonadales bacterium]
LTAAAAIGADQHLIVTYQTELDADTQLNATLTNVAGVTGWTNDDVANAQARTYSRTVTDGTVDVLDHEDAHTTVEFTPILVFEKRVANVTTGEDPATIATPGDTLHYTLYIENASSTPVDDFTIIDELDALNATPSFAPGTLTVTNVPGTADSSATDPNGGTVGTGLLEISGLSIGGLGDSLTVEFEVELAPAIANESVVLNQSRIEYFGSRVGVSDDPTIGGDEDPTEIAITSSPAITIEKTSAYLDGAPAVLLAGETLSYTITVQNTGTDHASGVEISDQIPASTLYVNASTTLNGAPVADSNGTSPLVDGMLINAPEDTTPGQLNAATANNVATITFDVSVIGDVPDGTVISNQAFVSAPPHGIADQPSDDPRTTLVNDPTRDIVGNLPLLFAEKSATLQVDGGSPGIIDPGDVLRYTIEIHNTANSPATDVELQDNVPANTTYVADSTTLNGSPVGQPDGGVFPLAGGLAVNSAGAGAGVLSPGESAVIQFDLRVDDGTASGTLISNQAVVSTSELSDLLTAGDGDPS